MHFDFGIFVLISVLNSRHPIKGDHLILVWDVGGYGN